jgi:hypothetical protein
MNSEGCNNTELFRKGFNSKREDFFFSILIHTVLDKGKPVCVGGSGSEENAYCTISLR